MRKPTWPMGTISMGRRRCPHVRRNAIPGLAGILTAALLAGFGMRASSAETAQSDPVTACRNLAYLTKFPVTPTRITLARFNPPSVTSNSLKALYYRLRDGTKLQLNSMWLPGHCQVRGIINERNGTDG